MTRYEIAILACKLAAMAMFAKAIASMSGIVGVVFRQPGSFFESLRETPAIILAGAGWFVAGYYCWNKAGDLAWNMVDDDEQPVVSLGFRPDELLSLGCSVIGLFLLLPALRSLLIGVTQVGFGELSLDDWWTFPQWRMGMVSSLVEAGFGCWMVLGSRGVRRVILRLRGMGVDDGESVAVTQTLEASSPSEET